MHLVWLELCSVPSMFDGSMQFMPDEDIDICGYHAQDYGDHDEHNEEDDREDDDDGNGHDDDLGDQDEEKEYDREDVGHKL